MSHRTAPVELLEQLALDVDGADKLRTAVLDTAHVSEAVVLATCNRIEIYAEVDRFHGSVEDLTRLLVDHAEAPVDEVLASLYVHYDEAAVAHLFEVVDRARLDGRRREPDPRPGARGAAARPGRRSRSAPRSTRLFQQGLRVGKRAHSETDIDRAGQSIVSVALERRGRGGRAARGRPRLHRRRGLGRRAGRRIGTPARCRRHRDRPRAPTPTPPGWPTRVDGRSGRARPTWPTRSPRPTW